MSILPCGASGWLRVCSHIIFSLLERLNSFYRIRSKKGISEITTLEVALDTKPWNCDLRGTYLSLLLPAYLHSPCLPFLHIIYRHQTNAIKPIFLRAINISKMPSLNHQMKDLCVFTTNTSAIPAPISLDGTSLTLEAQRRWPKVHLRRPCSSFLSSYCLDENAADLGTGCGLACKLSQTSLRQS